MKPASRIAFILLALCVGIGPILFQSNAEAAEIIHTSNVTGHLFAFPT